MGQIAVFLINGYMKISRYREPMAGGLMYDLCERMLIRHYGENEFTIALIEALPEFEDIKHDWQSRAKKK